MKFSTPPTTGDLIAVALGYDSAADLIAAIGGGTSILSAVLQADFPKTNDTLTAVPDLTLNLEAGKWYRITGQFPFLAEAAGLNVDFGGGTCTATGISGGATANDPVNGSNTAAGAISLDAPLTLGPGVADPAYFGFEFVIQVNTGGTLIPRCAQSETSATANKLLKYSSIQAIDVTPS